MRTSISSCLLGMGLIVATLAHVPSASSNSGNTELICLTENEADCYPRIFEPTEDFQIIKEGQDIPPGLHVRLNIYTGLKEARLNIPMEGEEDDGVIEVNMEQAVMVVPNPESDEDGAVKSSSKKDSSNDSAMRDRVPQAPPAYESAGKIKEPFKGEDDANESAAFAHAKSIIHTYPKKINEEVQAALEILVELSHDIYYGVEITKDPKSLNWLMEMMSNPDATIAHSSALIVANAVQNNPTALKEAIGSWKEIFCPSAKEQKDCEERSIVEEFIWAFKQDTDPAAIRAVINALHGFTKDTAIRDEFVLAEGMEHLAQIFIRPEDEYPNYDGVRLKIMNFITDTFLDEEMGAEVGLWPRSKRRHPSKCATPVGITTMWPGCWESYISEKMKGKEGSEMWKTYEQFFENIVRGRNVARGAPPNQGLEKDRDEL